MTTLIPEVYVRQRMQPAIDSGEYEVPNMTVGQVLEMLHVHFEENRIRREESL